MYELVNDLRSVPAVSALVRVDGALSLTDERMCGRIAWRGPGFARPSPPATGWCLTSGSSCTWRRVPFAICTAPGVFLALREDASKVSLRLEFEFSGRLINMAFGTVFSHIANNLVDAFCKRAREVSTMSER